MSKVPVILVHGLGLAQGIWDPYVPALREAGHEVVTYDLYGHGTSVASPGEVSLDLFAKQILALMDRREIAKAHLVGFSIGGMINRRFALDYPDRVASLAIWNSPHDRGEAAQEQVEARALKVKDEGPMATLEPALERWFTPGFREARPEVLDQVRAWRGQVHVPSYAGAAWVLANGVRELTGTDQPRGIPTQVLTCENDTGSTPAMSHDIARDLGAPEPIIIPDLQHLGLMERPELFLDPLLAFLKDQT